MAERAGSTVTVFILDVSKTMGRDVPDPTYEEGSGRMVQKLAWAKEYVTRKLVTLIQAGRKTEHICVILAGGNTNNPYADLGYPHLEVLIEPDTASTWMVDKIMNVELGKKAGDAFAGLSILMPLLSKHTGFAKPSWSYDISILTDGENSLYEADMDKVLKNIANLETNHHQPVRVQIAGFGFADKSWDRAGKFLEADKSKTKLASEALYRRFKKSRSSDSPTVVGNIYRAVIAARAPQLKEVKPTSSAMSLRIGDGSIDERQAIEIHVKVGKLTAIVRPAGSKKVAVRREGERGSTEASQSRPRGDAGGRGSQSQYASYSEPSGFTNPPPPSLTTRNPSADYGAPPQDSKYPTPAAEYRRTKSNDPRINNMPYYLDQNQPEVVANNLKPITTFNVLVGADEDGNGGEIQAVEKEKLTKAWRFGSSWIPIDDEEGTQEEKFETTKGLDLFKFVLAADFDREFEMGEVRYAWPSPDSSKSQIQLSSLVQAMLEHGDGEYYAIFRYCYQTNSAPYLHVAKGVIDDDSGQPYLQFCQLPFADDYRRFWFSPLENVINSKREPITVHSTIPTKEQMSAVGDLVDAMDLSDKGGVDADGNAEPWFDPLESYNPSVHRIKDAMYHQFTTRGREPLFPMHPDLVKFLDIPESIRDEAKEIGLRTAEILEVKKLPPKLNRKRAAEAAEEEDLGNLDDILAAPQEASSSSSSSASPPRQTTPKKTSPSTHRPSGTSFPLSKKARTTATDGDASTDDEIKIGVDDDSETDDEEDEALLRDPIGTYEKTLSYTGMDDAVAASKTFQEAILRLVARGEHAKALECLEVLRPKSIEIEESLAYNVFIRKLKKTSRSSSAPKKTAAFWLLFRKQAGRKLGLVTAQEDKYNDSTIEDEEADAFVA